MRRGEEKEGKGVRDHLVAAPLVFGRQNPAGPITIFTECLCVHWTASDKDFAIPSCDLLRVR